MDRAGSHRRNNRSSSSVDCYVGICTHIERLPSITSQYSSSLIDPRFMVFTHFLSRWIHWTEPEGWRLQESDSRSVILLYKSAISSTQPSYTYLVSILLYKSNNIVGDLFRVRCTQKMLSALDDLQTGIWRLFEQNNLLLRVGDAIHSIFSSLARSVPVISPSFTHAQHNSHAATTQDTPHPPTANAVHPYHAS
jgi:hypothetical protein